MKNYQKTSALFGLMLFVFVLLSGGLNQAQTSGQRSAQREIISMPGAKPSGLPFSPAVRAGNLMFLSGAIGTDIKTNQLVSLDVGGQTKQCLEKLGLLLRRAGMDFGNAVSVTVYLTDLKDYDAMNAIYAGYFPKDPPARACVQVSGLVRGAKVEISMIAMN